jgi:hypothetical protein
VSTFDRNAHQERRRIDNPRARSVASADNEVGKVSLQLLLDRGGIQRGGQADSDDRGNVAPQARHAALLDVALFETGRNVMHNARAIRTCEEGRGTATTARQQPERSRQPDSAMLNVSYL